MSIVNTTSRLRCAPVVTLILAVALVGASAWGTDSEKQQCTFKLPEDHGFTETDICALKALASRCSPGDACMLKCLAGRKGKKVGGGCYHLCSEHGTGNPPGSEYREPTAFYQCYWDGPSCEVAIIPSGLDELDRCFLKVEEKRCNPLDACFIRCKVSTLTPMIPAVSTCGRVCRPSWVETPWLPEQFTPPPGLDECGQ